MRALLVLAVLLAGCGGGVDCPNDLPAACPSPEPTYSGDAAPVIQTYCLKCHSGAGPGIGDFRTWSYVNSVHSRILDQLYSCRMPPGGEPRPTAQDRARLLGWLVCGAKNN